MVRFRPENFMTKNDGEKYSEEFLREIFRRGAKSWKSRAVARIYAGKINAAEAGVRQRVRENNTRD